MYYQVSDIGECVSSPCVHGTCTDQLNSYTCQCQPGYTGTNCDIGKVNFIFISKN